MNIGLRYSCFQYGDNVNINSFLRKEWTRDTIEFIEILNLVYLLDTT